MSDSEIYACSRCGECDIKLWREAHTFDPKTLCVHCLHVWLAGTEHTFDVDTINLDGTRWVDGRLTDQIGWWLPAVQVLDDLPYLAYWGYTSMRADDYLAWAALPLRKEDTDE